MADIIPVDFGKEARESARSFARLMKLVNERDEDILAHPAKYLDMAGKRLAECQEFRMKLYDALQTPWAASLTSPNDAPPEQLKPDTVIIDRRDYEALQALKGLIRGT